MNSYKYKNSKRKPRMTKSEKLFMQKIHSIVFAEPRIENGKKFMNVDAFNSLSQDDQNKFWHLHFNKTR